MRIDSYTDALVIRPQTPEEKVIVDSLAQAICLMTANGMRASHDAELERDFARRVVDTIERDIRTMGKTGRAIKRELRFQSPARRPLPSKP